jgi:hypothetical protein
MSIPAGLFLQNNVPPHCGSQICQHFPDEVVIQAGITENLY